MCGDGLRGHRVHTNAGDGLVIGHWYFPRMTGGRGGVEPLTVWCGGGGGGGGYRMGGEREGSELKRTERGGVNG